MASHTNPPTILIAEDDQDEVFLLEQAFLKTGLNCRLHFVPNGEKAIAYLEGKEPYDNRKAFPAPGVLLLDLKMPMVDGYDVLEWLQTHPQLGDLPVVVHSGSVLAEDRERTAKLGAKAYYVKSWMQEDKVRLLQDLYERWLEPAQNARAIPSRAGKFERKNA